MLPLPAFSVVPAAIAKLRTATTAEPAHVAMTEQELLTSLSDSSGSSVRTHFDS